MTDQPIEEPRAIVVADNLLSVPPVDMLRQAYSVAIPLAKAIQGARLAVKIKGREYVRVEGWTMCGSMLGVFPVVVSTEQTFHSAYGPDGEQMREPWGWEATVEARTRDGAVVGRAEAQCTRDEATWQNRDDYALRAMAQTRATSRALRGPLGFIVALGGFEATAAEEMPSDSERG